MILTDKRPTSELQDTVGFSDIYNHSQIREIPEITTNEYSEILSNRILLRKAGCFPIKTKFPSIYELE